MARISPTDPLRQLTGFGALNDLSKTMKAVQLVHGDIFPKVTTLQGIVTPLDDEVLRRVAGANLIGSQLRETLAKTNAVMLGRGIASSAALSAARVNIGDYGLQFGSLRIAELMSIRFAQTAALPAISR